MNQAALQLQDRLETAAKEFRTSQKELEKLNISRQQFLTQKHENDMVLKELKLLGEDAQVFKLVGPVMVKKDKSESVNHVQTRLDLINRELERVEKRFKEVEKEAIEKKEKLGQLQQFAQAQKQQQMQQQAAKK